MSAEITNMQFAKEKDILVNMVDRLAETCPDTIWAEIPVSDSTYLDGFRSISYRSLSNAVNGVAWWLKEQLQRKGDFETLCYFGPWDVRYVILLLGAVKSGYKMVFPSPGYSVDGLRAFLTGLQCSRIIHSSKLLPVVVEILDREDFSGVLCPSVKDFLELPVPHFDYDKTFEEAQNDPLVVLHTSGTSGTPKPFVWTHGWAASFIQQNQLTPPEGFESASTWQQGHRLLNMLPWFHCGCLFSDLLTAISAQTVAVFPLSKSEFKPDTFFHLIQHKSVDTAVVSPWFASAIASDPYKMHLVKQKVRFLAYAGGDIPIGEGEKLAKAVKLYSIYACTENGIFSALKPLGSWNHSRWQRLRFHPDSGVQFRRITGDAYEAVVTRNTKARQRPPIFESESGLQEWHTKDVFSPDSDEEGSWVYRCRVDDIIAFKDGSKFDPLPFESIICQHPEVIAALLFGNGRRCALLLIYLTRTGSRSSSNRLELSENVWTQIQRANEVAFGPAIITKPQIVFAESGKPLPRTLKGTLQRGSIEQLYTTEFESAMSKLDCEQNGGESL